MAGSEGGSSGEDSDVDSRHQDIDLEVGEKKRKPGIIYLSSVPDGMNVSRTTSFFAEFGRVGRVYLQKDKKLGFRKFTEGWIEFLSKRVAKRVAQQINSTQVGGKRRSKSYDAIWNIKYLPRFKWVHLSERLSYEQVVKQQRMRTEIDQVKRDAEHFKDSVRIKKRKASKSSTRDEDMSANRIPLGASPFISNKRQY
jgi:ESF2/ABP1 family protein